MPDDASRTEGIAASPKPAGAPFRVALIVVPGFSLMALSAAVEPLRSVNRQTGQRRYAWELIGLEAGPATASNGLEVATACRLAEASPADLTIVVASLGVETLHDRTLFGYLRALRRQRRLIGAISNGTLLLARAGLLAGRRATIHWEMHRPLIDEFPDIDIASTLYCWDTDVLTAAGGTAAMDMMLALIAVREGHDTAVEVSEQFLHGPARHSSELQRQNVAWRYRVTDRRVETAIRLMEERMAPPLSIARLAERAGVSERQLERLFGTIFGKSPSTFYVELRLRAARDKLLHSTQSLEEIAEVTDFPAKAISVAR